MEVVIRDSDVKTPDMGGKASTQELGDAVVTHFDGGDDCIIRPTVRVCLGHCAEATLCIHH